MPQQICSCLNRFGKHLVQHQWLPNCSCSFPLICAGSVVHCLRNYCLIVPDSSSADHPSAHVLASTNIHSPSCTACSSQSCTASLAQLIQHSPSCTDYPAKSTLHNLSCTVHPAQLHPAQPTLHSSSRIIYHAQPVLRACGLFLNPQFLYHN